ESLVDHCHYYGFHAADKMLDVGRHFMTVYHTQQAQFFSPQAITLEIANKLFVPIQGQLLECVLSYLPLLEQVYFASQLHFMTCDCDSTQYRLHYNYV